MSWLVINFSFFSFNNYKCSFCPFLQNPICCHWQSLCWMERFSSADLAFATNQLAAPSFSKLSAPAECNSVQDACQSARAVSLACSATLIGLNLPWNFSTSCICGHAHMGHVSVCAIHRVTLISECYTLKQTSAVWPQYGQNPRNLFLILESRTYELKNIVLLLLRSLSCG